MSDRGDHIDESDRKRKGAGVAAGVTAAAVAAAVIAGTESADTEAGRMPPSGGSRDPFDDLVPTDAVAPAAPATSGAPSPATPGPSGDAGVGAVPSSGTSVPDGTAPAAAASGAAAPVGAAPAATGGAGASTAPSEEDATSPAPGDLVPPTVDGPDPSAGADPSPDATDPTPVEAAIPSPGSEPAASDPTQASQEPSTAAGTPAASFDPDVTIEEVPIRAPGDGPGEPSSMPSIPEFMHTGGDAAQAAFVPDGGPVAVPPPPTPTPPAGFGAPPPGFGTGGRGAPGSTQEHNTLNDLAAAQAASAAAQAAAQGAASMATAPAGGSGLPAEQPQPTVTIDVVIVGEGEALPEMPPLAPGQAVASAPVVDVSSALSRYGDIPLNQLDAEDLAEVRAALGLPGPRALQPFMQDGSTLAEVFEASGVDINTALAGVDIDIPAAADPLANGDGSAVGGSGPGGTAGGAMGVTVDHTDYSNVLPAPEPTHFLPWDTVITEDPTTPQLDDNGFGVVGDSGQQIQWPEEWTL